MTVGIERYEQLAQDLVDAYVSADAGALQRIAEHHQTKLSVDDLRAALRHQLSRLRETPFEDSDLSLSDARHLVATWDDFESWEAMAAFFAAGRDDGPSARFEAAVDAVVAGDLATLGALLRDDPSLARARSARQHRATLLHYVSANGVEDVRQKSPMNAVEVAQMLLAAGAEVDAALADAQSTTLGLVATSAHPAEAGVQIPLLETLIAAGAAIDGLPGAWNPLGAALANGRGDAAAYLAERGAQLDLEGAAGVGRLDVVTSYFNDEGNLTSKATREQLRSAFAWACEFGRTNVVDYLLDHGMAVTAGLRHDGQTGLHWAAFGGHLETAKLLLQRGAPVNAKDPTYDGTPLGWALYAWGTQPPEFRTGRYYEVVALLVASGGTVEPEWLAEADRGTPIDAKVRADARMQAALAGTG